mgnify:CR=1 FL=1
MQSSTLFEEPGAKPRLLRAKPSPFFARSDAEDGNYGAGINPEKGGLNNGPSVTLTTWYSERKGADILRVMLAFRLLQCNHERPR